MNNEMAMYDWRMLKVETQILRQGTGHWATADEDGWGGSGPVGGLQWRGSSRKKIKSPKPVVKFKYSNEFMYPLGMDVCSELGLVAAGEEDGNVGVWSLRNGNRVRTLSGGGTSHRMNELVKCLRFVQDDEGPPRLMGSTGAKIVEWAW